MMENTEEIRFVPRLAGIFERFFFFFFLIDTDKAIPTIRSFRYSFASRSLFIPLIELQVITIDDER